jgi:hypothetical protein
LINGEKLIFNEPTELFLDESTYSATEYTGNEVEPSVLEQIQARLNPVYLSKYRNPLARV